MFLSLALALAPVALPAYDDGPPSIEELIEHYRERRDNSLEAMRAEVSELLDELLGHVEADRSSSMDEVRAQLIALGPEATPLLLGALDPGPAHAGSELELSRQVARVLQEVSLGAVHEPLFRMANSGSIAGRHLAVYVLGFSDDVALVGPALRELYGSGVSITQADLFMSLARLGGDENLSFVTDRLISSDRKEVDAALNALALIQESGVSDKVLSLASDTRAASKHVDALCAWYRACPDAFDKKHGEAILSLVEYSRLSSERRIELLNLLSAHEREWPSNAKKSLRELAKRGDQEFRREVLIVLALAGDGNARRDLIQPLESSLNESFFTSDRLTELAQVYYRIEEYRDAIKYYRRAFADGIYSSSDRLAVYLGLARCYARERKYKDAQEWLGKAPISVDELAELAEDPDFIEMAASKRYRKAFGISDN